MYLVELSNDYVREEERVIAPKLQYSSVKSLDNYEKDLMYVENEDNGYLLAEF